MSKLNNAVAHIRALAGQAKVRSRKAAAKAKIIAAKPIRGLSHWSPTSKRKLLYGAVASLAVMAALAAVAAPKSADAAGLSYHPGYSVQGSWLCYGFSNGIFHCTQHWAVVNGKYVSYNTPFVPSQSATSVPAAPRPTSLTSTSATVVNGVYNSSHNRIQYCGTQPVDFSNASAWATPHGCYGRIFYPSSSLGLPSFGWCNWASEASHVNYAGSSVLHLAKHYGAPRVGAVVWFNGGVQGASSDGHWANLVAIGPHGWGLIEEMNFYYRGGGWKKIDFRFIHLYTGGVAFLYA